MCARGRASIWRATNRPPHPGRFLTGAVRIGRFLVVAVLNVSSACLRCTTNSTHAPHDRCYPAFGRAGRVNPRLYVARLKGACGLVLLDLDGDTFGKHALALVEANLENAVFVGRGD